MVNLIDREYYERRSGEEALLAEQAETREIAAIRYELAYRYALLAMGKSALPRLLRLVA